MIADALQAKRLRVADQLPKHTVTSRQVADRAARLLVYSHSDEALESTPPLVQYPEGGVARPGQLAAYLDQVVQDRFELEIGHQRAANFHQPAKALGLEELLCHRP